MVICKIVFKLVSKVNVLKDELFDYYCDMLLICCFEEKVG